MKEIIRRYIKRKVVIWIVCFLLFTLFGYLIFNSHNVYSIASEEYRAGSIDAINNRIENLFLEINGFPQDEGNDILYLSKNLALKDLLREGGFFQDENRRRLSVEFFNFMEVNPSYYQLRYIDESGMEIIRVENDGKNLTVVEDVYLQDKKERYYFKDTMSLGENEVYVSRLDLNIENGVLENRGTEESPEYIPVIRYSVPIFDDDGKKRGFLIFNVYADYFLEDIRRMEREGEFTFLIDNYGYYLAHPNRSKEFSFMFGKEERIDLDYLDVGGEIITAFDKRIIEAEDVIFTFRHLYPTSRTFEIYQGSKKILGPHPEKERYWVLVSVSDSSVIEKNIENVRFNFIVSIVFSGFMFLVVIILLFIILAMNGSMDK